MEGSSLIDLLMDFVTRGVRQREDESDLLVSDVVSCLESVAVDRRNVWEEPICGKMSVIVF